MFLGGIKIMKVKNLFKMVLCGVLAFGIFLGSGTNLGNINNSDTVTIQGDPGTGGTGGR